MTIKEARKAQEQAKIEGKMNDVSFFSGYIAALIDAMPEEEGKVTRKKINDFLEEGGINLRA